MNVRFLSFLSYIFFFFLTMVFNAVVNMIIDIYLFANSKGKLSLFLPLGFKFANSILS